MTHGGKRTGAGRKAANIDLAEMEKLCTLQCTDAELAAWFGVSTRTIERRRKQANFHDTIERGQAKGRLSVRRMLFSQAAKGNTAAAIFLAKNLLGYRDVQRNEHSGPDGGPIAIENGIDLTRLSAAEIEQLLALVDRAQPVGGKS
jgi:hypothetical protein